MNEGLFGERSVRRFRQDEVNTPAVRTTNTNRMIGKVFTVLNSAAVTRRVIE
jgi:hypothetical protein